MTIKLNLLSKNGDKRKCLKESLRNTTHSLSEFISHNTETFREILLHKTLFIRAHIKQYWHFLRVTTKQYYTHFSEFISHNTFSKSYHKIIIHIFSVFISTKVTTKKYSKIILFCKSLSNKADICWVVAK